MRYIKSTLYGMCITAWLTIPTQASAIYHRSKNPMGVTIPLKATYTTFGTVYDAEITIGNQTVLLFLDTGSSDIWVAKTGYQCLNNTDNSILPREACGYSPGYDISPTFKQLPNQTFGVKYGAGISSGIVGYEKVTFGGLTIEEQVIGVADKVTNPGDGNDSGIIGLAYPAITSSHPGTNYPNDSISYFENRVVYNPVFTNIYEQQLVEPFFSLALTRPPVNASNADGGFLSLGTSPPVAHKAAFALAPVEILSVIPPLFTNNVTQKSYWALSITSVTFGKTKNSTSFQSIVDCGNFFNYLPASLALSINSAFTPPATKSADFELNGEYEVSCNAQPPSFGLDFSNNITIYMDARDMIIQNADGTCRSAVGDSDQLGSIGISFSILGTPFLRSVVSVWDFGKDEMRFAERLDSVNATVTSNGGTSTQTAAATTSESKPSSLVASSSGLRMGVGFHTLEILGLIQMGYTLFSEVSIH